MSNDTDQCLTENDLTGLIQHLKQFADRRRGYSVKHPLAEILFVAICANLCGFDSYREYSKYGKRKIDFFKRYLPFEKGIPSHMSYQRVLAALDPLEFESLLNEWMRDILNKDTPQVVAIDGKTIRGDKGAEKTHLVSAYATTDSLLLGQTKVFEKSNEITAIPELINKLDVENQVVSIDAMGCQKDIVKLVDQKNGSYVVNLKANHKNLYNSVQEIFEKQESTSCLTKDNKTTRTCHVINDLSALNHKEGWDSVASIVKIESTSIKKGIQVNETRFFISNICNAKPEDMLKYVRSHWHIENKLHWVLDVVFREDDRNMWNKNVIKNEAVIKRICVNLIRKYQNKHKDKTAMKTLRKLCIMDDSLLAEILDCF